MGKRGPQPGFNPKMRVRETWRPNLAYAIGLLVSDGCLSPAGHHIDLTSKDREQLKNFIKCIDIPINITEKYSGMGKKYLRAQFKNVLFYKFLLSIGLTPNKSKTIGALKIPQDLFWDFLRGSYDGDGSSYSYWDPRWRSSFMFYTAFTSASPTHIKWLRKEILNRLGTLGHVTRDDRKRTEQLKYAKSDSLKILRKMYYSRKVICLSRKRLKIEKFLRIVGERL